MDKIGLAVAIKNEARRLGFDHCRLTPLQPAPHADFFDAWVAQGRAGEMTYLNRNGDRRRDPALLGTAGAAPFRTLITLAVDHHQFDLAPETRDDPTRGLIAAYAWGDDYHEIIRPQLYALDAFIRSHSGRSERGKCLVDTGPVLERDWAEQAGIGFAGKNCCIIHPGQGSWMLLATILVPEAPACDAPPRLKSDVPRPSTIQVAAGLAPEEDYGTWTLATDSGDREGTCGRCTRCIDACPTDAFVGPYHLDPQRCISYWTIEAKAAIPRALRPHFANRIFGCDICQEVCPWNRRLPDAQPTLPGLRARSARIAPPLLEGFQPQTPYWLEQDAFSRHFRRSPIKRAKRRGMLRNVCVALGNWAAPETVPALTLALCDPEPLARGHAAWALGQVWQRGVLHAREILAAHGEDEDPWVQEEIALALGGP